LLEYVGKYIQQAPKQCDAASAKLKAELVQVLCKATTRSERRRFWRRVFCQRKQLEDYFVTAPMSALNLAAKLLPDTKHALAFVGTQRPTYAMVKTVAAVALSNDQTKFQISREERGRQIDSSTVIAFRN
jgi:hypothetical protein